MDFDSARFCTLMINFFNFRAHALVTAVSSISAGLVRCVKRPRYGFMLQQVFHVAFISKSIVLTAMLLNVMSVLKVVYNNVITVFRSLFTVGNQGHRSSSHAP